MLSPYLVYLVSGLIIIINVIYIFIIKGNWVVLLIINIAISAILNILGLGEYDFLTNIINTIVDLIGDLIGKIFDFGWW